MQALNLLHRETGDLSPDQFSRLITSSLLTSFAATPNHRFHGGVSAPPSYSRPGTVNTTGHAGVEERAHHIKAHASGVSALTLEKFDGRVLVSGGADGGLKLWDLEDSQGKDASGAVHTFRPVGTIARVAADESGSSRGRAGHSHGVTHLGFYPFDPDAFLSSSYDKTLKLWSTTTGQLSASFSLNATVYSHATSPIAQHLLVACATQHSNVRLVDLKSGAAVQALVAHGGPVLSVCWSPTNENILVSGHADGRVRVWDVRKGSNIVGVLDQEDSVGVRSGEQGRPPRGTDGHAHDEAVNALTWTDDGRYIVSAGLDRRIRVWDADTGANTLASYGGVIQNSQALTSSIVTSPTYLSSGMQYLFWPNDQEILILDLHEGHLIGRLRTPGGTNPLGKQPGRASSRITSIAWRGAGGDAKPIGPSMGGGNALGGIYSAHQDGVIRAWTPRIPGGEDFGEDGDEEGEKGDNEAKKRKRKAVDDAYRSLMGKQVTYT